MHRRSRKSTRTKLGRAPNDCPPPTVPAIRAPLSEATRGLHDDLSVTRSTRLTL